MSEPQQPVFYDSTQRRQVIASFLFYFVSIVSFIAFCGFVVSIVETPNLSGSAQFQDHRIRPTSTLRRLVEWTDAPIPGFRRNSPSIDYHLRARLRYVLHHDRALSDIKIRLAEVMKTDDADRRTPIVKKTTSSSSVTLAFYVGSESSYESLEQHADQITHFAPAWFMLNADGSGFQDIEVKSPGSIDKQAEALAKRSGMIVLPVLQNFSKGVPDPAALETMLESPTKRAKLIGQLATTITAQHFQGINIDLEDFKSPLEFEPYMTLFMTELSNQFHARHLLVTQDVTVASKVYDLANLAKVDDFIVPMLYDEHSSGTQHGLGAGPIASNNWFRDELATFMASVPANKAVIGLAGYSYDWEIGSTTATSHAFGEAANIAQQSMDGSDGVIQSDRRSGNPYFTYYDEDGQAHIVWMQDAVTAYNYLVLASSYHPLGAALWRLGDEDPSIWDFFGRLPVASITSFNPQALSTINYGYFGIQRVGWGDIFSVVATPKIGQRTITVDSQTGLVNSELFTKYPSQYVLRHTGRLDSNGYNSKKVVALTFDDGPDPRWTPEILNILHQYKVPATFFVIGENAEANPGIVQREWDEGMEIGNHSFTHPDFDRVSPERIKLELDATQRVIEAITGHETRLFRAPNRADSDPSTVDDLAPVIDGDNLGYLFVGESIDPTDWAKGITAHQIIYGKHGVLNSVNAGNCILLHDAGGDTRAETVRALPQIINLLRKDGYRFVLVSALIPGKTKADLFPPVSGKQLMYVLWDRFAFDAAYWIFRVLSAIFIMTIILGIGRIVIFTTLALIQYNRETAPAPNPMYIPTVSVVIAAYNESKVINKTISALLTSDYPNLEIVVIDDGSTDGTSGAIRRAFFDRRNVRIIEKVNGGKASALNLGIKECSGEIIIALDADTIFDRSTIGKLVRHFEDPAIGAVSGNVKVGNRHNSWTWWQALEYITSQNFDRRAFSLLNCISVVPGAVGAWRKDAVMLAGLYSSQTLAEDTDLTFKVRQLGYRIITDNEAMAYTEAPDTLKDLSKQRFRWAYGTLQCLWKHRSALFNTRFGAFGFFALPCLWTYQIVFQALAPLVDAAILWTIFYGSVFAPQFEVPSTILLLQFWFVFTLFELIGAFIALKLDQEDLKLLVWLPLQRFVYRQMMYYVILKSIVTAVKGTRVGWGKLDRRGNVSAPIAIKDNEKDPISAMIETR